MLQCGRLFPTGKTLSSLFLCLSFIRLVLIILVSHALWRCQPKLSALLMQLHFVPISVVAAWELLLSTRHRINSVKFANLAYSELRLHQR